MIHLSVCLLHRCWIQLYSREQSLEEEVPWVGGQIQFSSGHSTIAWGCLFNAVQAIGLYSILIQSLPKCF